ncbi:MAG: flavodoxin [Odoribacter splanchnicus]|jgi:flavodoxin
MKKYLIYLTMAAAVMTFGACSSEDENEPQTPEIETPDISDSDSKILVAYFSWGGTTQRMAQEIVRQTGADLFRIEPVVPYPTEYTPCTEVAREEKDNNARPAIAATVKNWADYDTVFIGCPVWWWTTPMIICTFAESYDFKGKTVVPFCTYAATYRDETLARIVELTPDATTHLTGEGLTSGRINGQTIGAWLRNIGMVK